MFPRSFEERMKKLLGEDYGAFELEFTNGAPVKSFRVNTVKMPCDRFCNIGAFDTEKIPYTKDGFYYSVDKIGLHPLFHAGALYPQDPGAMSVISAIDIDPSWRVLDLCAAPGGKSAQISAALDKKRGGILVSNEINAARCKMMTGNFERLGLDNVIVTNSPPKLLCETYSRFFDLIVVDAPCSGEGMFRKEPEALAQWSDEIVSMCAQRQGEIIDAALEMLKPGGYILYSTCTYSLEENEGAVSYILEKGDFETIPVADAVVSRTAGGVAPEGSEVGVYANARRFYPHISPGEGQFLCLLKHKGESEARAYTRKIKTLSSAEESVVVDFLRENTYLCEDGVPTLEKHGEGVFIVDGKVPLPEHFLYLPGIKVGEVRKNVLVPHHQFFSVFGNSFKRKLDLSMNDDRLEKYLHGETINAPDMPNGWCALTLYSAPIGGGKAVGGIIKNHYPKGLRSRV